VERTAATALQGRDTGAQHIEYRVHDPSIVGASASAASAARPEPPIIVAEIKSHAPPPSTVNHVRSNYSVSYLGTDPIVPFAPVQNFVFVSLDINLNEIGVFVLA
jgi:hypothetical protein